jgi:hypothetical protein
MMHRVGGFVCLLLALLALSAQAQTPAPASPPPAPDQPSIKLGVLIFADYTVQQQPKITDADGNEVTYSTFQITRSYINVTGNITKNIAFRLTPDIVRETSVGSSLNGSYAFRLKYAFIQWNLDNYLTPGSFARFGMQQNPWIDFIDSVYRYRFQGQTFEDREGYLPSADTGATFHYSLPGNYGDVHTGFYNGETFQRVEVNDQKAFQVRGTLRPLPGNDLLKGLRLTGFYDHDAYVKNAERRRGIFGVTYEHRYLNAGFNFLSTTDQISATRAAVDGRGWSMFVTPKTTMGWEGLFRVDHLEPNTDVDGQKKDRTIGGIAYWFPEHSGITTALLFDVDNVKYAGFSPSRPTERRFALHALLNF